MGTATSGRHGEVLVDGTVVAELTRWRFNQDAEKFPAPAMGDSNKKYVEGLPDAVGELEFNYDPTDATQELLKAAQNVTLKLRPIGNATGQKEFTIISIIDTSALEGAVEGGPVSKTIGFAATADVIEGIVP